MEDTERDKLLLELTSWENDLKPLKAQWDLYWNRWELVPPEDKDNPYLSRFTTPYPFSHVETILPRIVGQDPHIEYLAIDEEDDDPKAQMLAAVVNWQMALMRFEAEVRTFVRQGLITGFSVAKLGWVRETEMVEADVIRTVFHDEAMAEFDTTRTEQVEMVKRNEAFFETVDIYDFVWPLNAISLNKAPAVWQRCWVTKEHLREMQTRGFYTGVDKVQAWAGEDRRTDMAVRLAAQGINPSLPDDPEQGDVELWERWSDDRLVVIANREHVLRDQQNPFWHQRKPFIDYAPVERPFSMQGVGIIKMMWDMNEDLGALRRQRRDAITYSINPMWKATEAIQESDIVIRPGGLFKVPDTDDIEPMTAPAVDFASSYQEEQNAKNDKQQVTGAFDYLSGVNPGGVQTATAVATVTQEGSKRISEMIGVFGERAMKRLGHQLASLCTQYMDNEVAIPLWKYPEAQAAWTELRGSAAPRIAKVGRDDISTAGKVLPLPEVGIDQQQTDLQKRSDAVQAITAIAPLLAMPTPVVDPKALVDYMLKQFGVDSHERAKILDTANAQQVQVAPTSDGSPPQGGVVGAAGVAGPAAGPQAIAQP